MNILVLDLGYNRPFLKYGKVHNTPEDIFHTHFDLIVFPGGPDVPPSYYGEKVGKYTQYSVEQYKTFDMVFNHAVKRGINMTGICGGAQYLCAKAGGRLIQHVTNHAIRDTHPITTDDGRTIEVTSTHHQMMYPFDVDHKLLAWADGLSDKYLNGDNIDAYKIDKEPDVVFFPKINALAAQYHPEYMTEDSEGYQYYQQMLERYVI